MSHPNSPPINQHPPWRWTVDDEAARLALEDRIDFQDVDEDSPLFYDLENPKVLWQRDDLTQWILTNLTPTIWQQIATTVDIDTLLVTDRIVTTEDGVVTDNDGNIVVIDS